MSERDLDPLGSELESLLDAERGRPAAAPRSRNRVLSRVHASLAIGALGGGIPGGGDPALGGGGAPGGGALPGAGGAATGGVLASLFGKPLVIGLTAFALGGAVGAASVYANLSPAAPVVAVSGPLSSPASGAPIAPPPPADLAPAPQPSETLAASAVPTSRAPAEDDTAGHDATLAAERALLEVARSAVARKDSGAAFEALGRHAREFPRGRLSEEREGLWIQALIGAGRTDDARQRASRFKNSFPRSMLLPGFEKALGTIP